LGFDPANGRVMLNRDVLHPLHIGHVVNMTVFINGGWRNGYGFCVDFGKRHVVQAFCFFTFARGLFEYLPWPEFIN
jgi:hypothetical protein